MSSICLNEKFMDETSTLHYLILYYFNETQMIDTVLVQKSIDHDEEIACEYDQVIETFESMDRLISSPSEKSLDFIFNYSKKLIQN